MKPKGKHNNFIYVGSTFAIGAISYVNATI